MTQTLIATTTCQYAVKCSGCFEWLWQRQPLATHTPIKCIINPDNQCNSVGVSCEFATPEELLLQYVSFIGMRTMWPTHKP